MRCSDRLSSASRGRRGWARRARGGAYLLLLFAVAAIGMFTAVAGEVWSTMARREKEAQLLFVGGELRSALESYYQASSGERKDYPTTVKELLLDPRVPFVRRHLRQSYRDPFTGSSEWGLVRRQGQIIGFYSLGKGQPLKCAGFSKEEGDPSFANARSYADWRFMARTGLPPESDAGQPRRTLRPGSIVNDKVAGNS